MYDDGFQIPDNHIGNTRDTSFENMVMNRTNGKGVDIILNSLAEEKLQASVDCLAENGSFVEIGKFDLTENNPLGKSTVFFLFYVYKKIALRLIFDYYIRRKDKKTKSSILISIYILLFAKGWKYSRRIQAFTEFL